MNPFYAVIEEFWKEYLELRKECLNPTEVNIEDLDPETARFLDEKAKETFPKIQKILKESAAKKTSKPDAIKIGQVWTTKQIRDEIPSGPLGTKIVILVENEMDGLARGIPISDQFWFAARHDMVVAPDAGLPDSVNDWHIVQLWAECNFYTNSLDTYIGMLDGQLFNQIQTLRAWRDGDKEVKPIFENPIRLTSAHRDVVVEEMEIYDPVLKKEYKVRLGQPIRRCEIKENPLNIPEKIQDKRILFREYEREDLAYLKTPLLLDALEAESE